MNDYRFGVYDHKYVDKNDNNQIQRSLIVLKDSYGNIVRWTDFHRYARNPKDKTRSLYVSHRGRCIHICILLNYVFFDNYHIDSLNALTSAMVIHFLQDYGLCKLKNDTEKTHRSKNTVETCIRSISDFIKLLSEDNPECKIKFSDLFRKEKIFSKSKRRFIDTEVPKFEVLFRPATDTIFRDLPDGAFEIIMNKVITSYPKLLMLFALSAFAGLRPSEACNVRREDSPLGPGIRFEMTDGEVTNVFIDLREEKSLRSDMVNVGSIKKERIQKVYPNFLNIFVDCYNRYMKYIEGHPYETEYGALTNTSYGKAYTYPAYRVAFQNIVESCIPEMLASEDAQIVHYGHLLQEKRISPHILRHWYSVKLTLYGEDVAGLMTWRGDKSPESALTYLQNKSELEKQFNKVSEKIFDYSLWKAEKLNGGIIHD